MALTESKLRQIIREEAAKMMKESEHTPRGLPTRRGEPRDMDPNRNVAYGRGDGSSRGDYPRGGDDERRGDPGRKPNLNPDRWWDAEYEDELEDDGF